MFDSPATVIMAKEVTNDHLILMRIGDRAEWIAVVGITATFGDGTGEIGIELMDGRKFRANPKDWLIVTGR